MQTSRTLNASAAYATPDGYTDPQACVTKPGYGYDGRAANPCAAGSYNAAGNYGLCTQCPSGLTTSTIPEQQASMADCKMAPGYGLIDNVVQMCRAGGFASGQNSDTKTATY